MNIYQWMLENITDNGFSAKHIYEDLHLHEFSFEKQQEMCLLYRAWRPNTETKKSKLIPAKQVYDLVLAGIDPSDVEPRQIELPEKAEV